MSEFLSCLWKTYDRNSECFWTIRASPLEWHFLYFLHLLGQFGNHFHHHLPLSQNQPTVICCQLSQNKHLTWGSWMIWEKLSRLVSKQSSSDMFQSLNIKLLKLLILNNNKQQTNKPNKWPKYSEQFHLEFTNHEALLTTSSWDPFVITSQGCLYLTAD